MAQHIFELNSVACTCSVEVEGHDNVPLKHDCDDCD